MGIPSQRHIETIRWMAEGKTAAEISVILGRHQRTIEKRIFTAKKVAGVYKDTALVAVALRNGWIQ